MKKFDLERWQKYFTLREEGHAVERAARGAKIDSHTAWRFERGEPGSTGIEAAEILGVTHVGGLEVAPPLSREAQQALDDFGYFRMRYFGRASMPWQEKAAYIVVDKLNTPDREFVVINCPPGSGKSTLFTHDMLAWLIARDRGIRMMVAHRVERLARQYVGRLKNTFEREVPMMADANELKKGIAWDAAATLSGDFGAFKPEGREQLWRADALIVRQFGGALDDKEPTVSAWGQDSGFLGGRFDLVIWDDLVDRKNTLGLEAGQKTWTWWTTEAETRVEPGGLLILQGQRIAPDDLYHECINLTDLEGEKKYTLVRFQAHDESRCTHNHGHDAPPQPTGCLLDPYRLPWKFLSNIAATNPRVYDIQYQQNDGHASAILVEDAWITGDKPDSFGITRPGCLDNTRPFGETSFEEFTGWSVVTVDPSPVNFWGILWWVMDPGTHRYELVEIHRKRLGSEDFLSIDMETHEFSGLLEEIRMRANDAGHPLQSVVIEINAAQRFLLAQPHMQKWSIDHTIDLLPHSTTINKADPEYGVTGIADFFRQGAIRIPYGDTKARLSAAPYIHELITWPEGKTDDLVMSTWFGIRAVQMTYAAPDTPAPRFSRPSWLGTGRSVQEVYGGLR